MTSNKILNSISSLTTDSNIYQMNCKRPNVLIIFNHIGYIDANNIRDAFIKLNFAVTIHNNLKYSEIITTLRQATQYDYTDVDCLAIAVITHGDYNFLNAADKGYNPSKLWEFFESKLCPTLEGKPKLFFVDACRGKLIDEGQRVQFDGGLQSVGNFVPETSDFLVVFSTQNGHYGLEDSKTGSWFIHALCIELTKRYQHYDLMTILTFVNRRLAFNYEGSKDSKFKGCKQSGSIVSTLTQLLYFK